MMHRYRTVDVEDGLANACGEMVDAAFGESDVLEFESPGRFLLWESDSGEWITRAYSDKDTPYPFVERPNGAVVARALASTLDEGGPADELNITCHEAESLPDGLTETN